jgi:flagellar motor switch/type III secretory pathway protein FliN
MSSQPVAVSGNKNDSVDDLWEQAGLLPCSLSVDAPLQQFTVRDLLQLEPGVIVESKNVNGADVPVFANARLIGWAEFEVVGHRLAIRLTELV